MRIFIAFIIVNILFINFTLSNSISNCSSCDPKDKSAANVLENSKSDEEVCKFSKYSAAFKKEAANRGLDCENLKKVSNVFGKELGKVKPKDPFFHLKRIKMICLKKNGKKSQKTLMGYISSEYFYAIKSSTDIALIVVGYFDASKDKLIIKGVENYFPKKSRSFYKYEQKFQENIFRTLKNNIKGTNKYNENCSITSNLKWGGDYVPYEGESLTMKEKKDGLKRAINVLKMFDSNQYDLSQTLAQNGFVLGFKFELSDLMTDLSMKLAKLDIETKIIIKEDKESKKIAEQKSKELEKEKARRIAEQKERKILEAKTKKLAEEKRLAELKAKKRTEEIAKEIAAEKQKKIEEERALRKAEQIKRKKAEKRAKNIALEKKKAEEKAKKIALEKKEAEEKARKEKELQLAALNKEKVEKQKIILAEKMKRDKLEKKLASLEEEKNKTNSNGNLDQIIKLPVEWMPFKNDMSLQQKQFCQLTDRFFKDIEKAYKSKNEIKVNMVHKERQENLDGLLPGGKVNNWIFRIVKIDQVEDGSAAVVLSLQCNSFVGSGQIHTKSSWRRKSNKEWRATIPYDDRRFRELAKLDSGQFILGSGTFLEINAFKPGQIETFYASQQIGEHPLAKNLNLEGELFLADLSYIAALN